MPNCFSLNLMLLGSLGTVQQMQYMYYVVKEKIRRRNEGEGRKRRGRRNIERTRRICRHSNKLNEATLTLWNVRCGPVHKG